MLAYTIATSAHTIDVSQQHRPSGGHRKFMEYLEDTYALQDLSPELPWQWMDAGHPESEKQ